METIAALVWAALEIYFAVTDKWYLANFVSVIYILYTYIIYLLNLYR